MKSKIGCMYSTKTNNFLLFQCLTSLACLRKHQQNHEPQNKDDKHNSEKSQIRKIMRNNNISVDRWDTSEKMETIIRNHNLEKLA